MKLIIDIPDEMYDWAINYNKFYQTYSKNDLLEVIQNGKPVIVEADKKLEGYNYEDCISRQAAKRALEDRYIELQKRHDDKKYETNYCLNTILELPPVNPKNPKRETAKWIRRSGIMSWKWFECDRCTTGYDFETPYCPHCGCEMTNSETTYTTSAKEE